MDHSRLVDMEESLRFLSFSSMPTAEDLKQKYRSLIKLYHPDLNPQDASGSTQMMQRLNLAYETIMAGLNEVVPAPPPASVESLRRTAREGDDAVRDAVIVRCLSRMRNNVPAQMLCGRVRDARDSLLAHSECLLEPLAFFVALFSQFLKVVESGQLLPLPFTWNSTRFHKNLSLANGYLDLGIRSYYHYQDGKRLRLFRNVPLSYLDDAEKAFGFLRSYVHDAPHRRMLRDRFELIGLYRARLEHPGRLTV